MKLEAVSGMMLTLLLIGMLTMASDISPVEAQPFVRVYVYQPLGYVPGQPVGSPVVVDIIIEVSGIADNSPQGIHLWAMDVQVDPDVLEIDIAVGATTGYFLWEFADARGYDSPTLMQGTRNEATGFWDELAEMIMPTPPGGSGEGFSGYKLVTLRYHSKSETAFSLIDLIDVEYRDATGTWHAVDEVIDGHYNALAHVANNVLYRSTTSHGGMGGGSPASSVRVGNYYGWDGVTHYFNTDMRFKMDIPQGATIIDARLFFTARNADEYSQSPSSNAQRYVNTKIYGEDVDDAPDPEVEYYRWVRSDMQPGGHYYWYYDVTRTSAFVDWYDIEPWYEDNVYYSPDISNIIQEIVDRPGWSPGNTLTILWEEHDSSKISSGGYTFRLAYGYGQGDKTVKLEVTYED